MTPENILHLCHVTSHVGEDIYVCLCVYTCVYTCVHIRVSICVCVYTHVFFSEKVSGWEFNLCILNILIRSESWWVKNLSFSLGQQATTAEHKRVRQNHKTSFTHVSQSEDQERMGSKYWWGISGKDHELHGKRYGYRGSACLGPMKHGLIYSK